MRVGSVAPGGPQARVKSYDHGDVWTPRLKRSKRMKQISGGLMVPTQRSPADDVRRTKACDEIEAALRELGAEVPRVPIPRRSSRFRAAA